MLDIQPVTSQWSWISGAVKRYTERREFDWCVTSPICVL